MRRNYSVTAMLALMLALALGSLLASCSGDAIAEEPYVLQEKDIKVEQPEGGFTTKVNQLLRIEVKSVSDEGISYQWLLAENVIARTKSLEHMFEEAGEFDLSLNVSQNEISFEYDFRVTVIQDAVDPEKPSAYITKVLDFMPAAGQFTNQIPKYEEGDTQETINAKVLKAIGNNNRGMISLGGFGGYVVVGFDHTIENVEGKCDFRVLGNAFYASDTPELNMPEGGSCEPGIVMVAYDANKNGVPDDDEWYEIAGSSHMDPTLELWYDKALEAGNDVDTYFNYEITYYRPAKEPETEEEMLQYIRWEDNKGNSGYKSKSVYHGQCYYPLWVSAEKISFTGTCLPQNGVDESGQGDFYVLYKFGYGYADNAANRSDGSAIDIGWAVDGQGQKVNLPGADFIKIYTGVNQENGWLGECSTEVCGIEDLHVLEIDIDTLIHD